MTFFRRKTFWIVLLTFALLCIGLGLGLRAAAPEWARRELLTRLRVACPACRFEVRRLELGGILSGRVVARGVGFLSNPLGTHFSGTADALTVDVRLKSLWEGPLWIEGIRIDGLHLIVADYAGSPDNTEAPSYPFIATLPPVYLGGLQVRDAKFTYALDHLARQKIAHDAGIPDTLSVAESMALQKHHSFIPFHSIDADFGPVGTRREFSPDFVTATATASQSKTARVRLAVRMGVFENEKIDDIEIWAKSADLSAIDSMFKPAEGIKISGYLREGHAKIDVRKRKLTAHVSLAYDKLKVHYMDGHPGRDRLDTLLSNLFSGALIDQKKRSGDKDGNASATVTVEQKPFDNVFTFLVEGLSEAIREIVSSG